MARRNLICTARDFGNIVPGAFALVLAKESTERHSISRSEVEAIELPSLLVERYEEEHYSVPKADPVSIVRFLLEQQI